MGTRHDPEIAQLQRESLQLIIASEKVLTALEDHIAMLRTFVQSLRPDADTPDEDEGADGHGG